MWVEYTHPQEFAGGNLYGATSGAISGNSLNGIGEDAALQPAYQIADVKIGFATDEWEIYAYVDNS